jgi:hypothetical protein
VSLHAAAVVLVFVTPSSCCCCCRYLLLDGRSNTELAGVKALRCLGSLRALLLPLLHLHHADRGLLASLSLALPGTVISNVTANFGTHHGCQVGGWMGFSVQGLEGMWLQQEATLALAAIHM